MRGLLVSCLVLLALDRASGMLRHPLRRERPGSPSLAAENKPRYSNDWAVEVNGGVEIANQIAAKLGFINMGQIGDFKNHYRFQMLVNVNGSSAGSTYTKNADYRHIRDRSLGSFAEIGLQSTVTSKLQSENMIGRVEQLRLKRHSKKEFRHPSDPKFDREWSLLNTGQIGSTPFLDLNVERAWMQGITGEGIIVGFVDDGLEHTHPDLTGNYDSYASHDFVDQDSDPIPTNYYGDEPDRHGTSCAGEVGMSKDNNNCGVGVAYGCKIGGLKLDLANSEDLTESEALSYHLSHIDVYSNSWGPADYGFIVDGPGYHLASAFEYGVRQGRNGLGSIFIWAAGNGGEYYDSCTADGYASSIYTIAVGSADQNGKQADYDEFCSSKMAVTFSYDSWTFPSADDNWTAYNQVTTTTLNGECTDDFTGTSASTPLMSGVAALTLQANPQLTWRDMQYLVVYTSDPSKLVDGDWQVNGGGLKVSHKFGFGAVDAEAMVTRAKKWMGVPDKLIRTVQPSGLNYGTVRNHQPWTTTFNVQSSDINIAYLEHIVVNMTLTIGGYSRGYDISDFEDEASIALDVDQLYKWLQDPHPRRGDIKIQLTSPQGTTSILLPYRNYDFINEDGYTNWPFMSVQHWGEDPSGTWTLTVNFKSSYGYVQASSVAMTLHGTPTVPAAVLAIPRSCDQACARNCSGPRASDCDACSDYRVAATLECVSTCPSATYAHNKYCLSGSRQPDHNIVYPDDNGKVSIFVYIGSGLGGVFLLAVITGVVIGVIIAARKRSQRSTGGRQFRYAPIAPAAV